MERPSKEPELHNEDLEKAIAEFKKNQTNENMVKILQGLEKAMVMQPAFLPTGADKEEIRKMIQQGQGGKVPVQLSAQMRPRPVILKNEKGQQFFGVFTGKAQIPENQKYPAMMFVPFRECARLAVKPELQLMGIVLNPFTDNLTLHKAALEMMNQKLKGQGTTVQMPISDLILQKGIAWKFHVGRAEFMQEVTREKGTFVLEVFQEAYRKIKGEGSVCPYQEKDFEVMSLNISETLQMVRIGLAEGGSAKGQYGSAFCFYNPVSGEGLFYLIKKGTKSSPNLLYSVDGKGTCTEMGEAPPEGSELYELMKKVPWES